MTRLEAARAKVAERIAAIDACPCQFECGCDAVSLDKLEVALKDIYAATEGLDHLGTGAGVACRTGREG